jgi:hypothetical protein
MWSLGGQVTSILDSDGLILALDDVTLALFDRAKWGS